MSPISTPEKVDVPPQHWDAAFAPSSALALITTVDGDGRVNAAAFGTCTRVCHDPMHIAFTCAVGKDTTNNVLTTGQFVVNLVPFDKDVLDRVLVCGLPFKPGIDELERAGLTETASRIVLPPRVRECTTHFECTVAWTHQWLHRVMICGKVEAVSIDAGCMDEKGFIVWDKVRPSHYCGAPYKDRFVPTYNAPLRARWHYEGTDAEFREGEDWGTAFQSKD
jgi:flavin reductase (DIM6/NTAB) family NADH-FMN oxidoreductase RutF